jgi:hypothetical protein
MRRSKPDQWIAQMLSDTPLRTSSLIITLYGDGIEPHGGCVWLGSLIDLVAPLGINDRAIRWCPRSESNQHLMITNQLHDLHATGADILHGVI